MRIVSIEDLKNLVGKVGIKTFYEMLIEQLRADYSRWEEFQKSPRHAVYLPQGVIELMPIADAGHYAFKYVNGHPENPAKGKLTVVALGMMSQCEDGYPTLLSEMTLLTAFRTSAVSALASAYLARKKAKRFGIIGTGAQSEFQVLAHNVALGLDDVYYFDIDPRAMEKFKANLEPFNLTLHACQSGQEVVENSEILTVAVAAPGHQKVVLKEWVKPGTHLNGIGGDSPGKTELDPKLTSASKIVVQFLEQTRKEGEIQLIRKSHVWAELWEVVSGKKQGRENESEITLFDSVGFALEDFSALSLVQKLATQYNVGHQIDMIPDTLQDPKNLFSLLSN